MVASLRRTQADRSRLTRTRILDAALDLLAEQGYGRTTTQAVAERAGVSRGAQLHHFRTRNDLVIAALLQLARRRRSEIRAEIHAELAAQPPLPPAAAVERAVRALSRAFSGPHFAAALELWVAARTDPALRAALQPVEREIARELDAVARELLAPVSAAGQTRPPGSTGAGADPPAHLVEITVDLLLGLAVSTTLSGDQTRQRRLIRSWSQTLTYLLEGLPG